MDDLIIAPLFEKERVFFAERHTGWHFMPTCITCQSKNGGMHVTIFRWMGVRGSEQ